MRFVPARGGPGLWSSRADQQRRVDRDLEFVAGVQMRITGAVDTATLKAAVAALADGRQR